MSRTVRDVSRMSWRGALIMALLAFLIFYLGVPAFLRSLADSDVGQTGYLKPLTDMVIFRRLHWAERFGLALTLACLIIAAWKAATARHVSSGGQWFVRFISRLVGRELD